MRLNSFCDYESINKGYQILHDCYLVSSLKALNKTKFGRQMLSSSIKKSAHVGEAFEIKFNGLKHANKFLVEELGNYQKVWWRKDFTVIGAIEYATDRMIKHHPHLKSIFSRLFSPFAKRFEYNKANLFLEKFTGKKPLQLGDNGILPLSCRKKKALSLLKKISETPQDNHSFVTATLIDGCSNGIADNHYYVIAGVDMNSKKVKLGNPRIPHALTEVPFNSYMRNFRSIVGYFEETVK